MFPYLPVLALWTQMSFSQWMRFQLCFQDNPFNFRLKG